MTGLVAVPSRVGTSQPGQIPGTNTNDNAATGNDGEFTELSVPFGSAVPLVDGVTKDITSLSLTAGDWEVWGVVDYSVSGATPGLTYSGISLATNALGSQDWYVLADGPVGAFFSYNAPRVRVSTASTIPVYLNATCAFAAGSVSVFGTIRARRMR